MFWLLLNTACLHSIKAFSLLPSPLVSRLRVEKRLGGHIAKRADQIWPVHYLIIYDILLSNESSGRGGRRDLCGSGIFLPKQPLCFCFPGSSIFWGVADSPHFPFHVAFTFLIKVSLPLPVSLLTIFLFCPYSANANGEIGGCLLGHPLYGFTWFFALSIHFDISSLLLTFSD